MTDTTYYNHAYQPYRERLFVLVSDSLHSFSIRDDADEVA